jgi:hypothetical protein
LNDSRGQVWPLALALLLALLLTGLPLLSAWYTEGTVFLAQRAADAAALAGAKAGAKAGAQLTRQADAFGDTYCESVTVDQSAALQAAAAEWSADTTQGYGRNGAVLVPAPAPSLQTVSFAGVASGSTFAVTATVQAPAGGLLLAGIGRTQWTVASRAEVVQPPGVQACP